MRRLSAPHQRGVALSSPLALLSVAAVVVAGAAFVRHGNDEEPDAAAAAAPPRRDHAVGDPRPDAPRRP